MKLLTIFLLLISFHAQGSCRSGSVKHKFDVINGFPHGRIGYVVDHRCALKCGGLDSVTNMAYQTKAEGKAKDRWELTKDGCAKTCNTANSTPTRQVFNCK